MSEQPSRGSGGGAQPALHEWNRGFRWTSPARAPRFLSPEQAKQYDTEGYTLLRAALRVDEVARMVREIDPIEAEVERALRAREGGREFIARAGEITFSTHLVLRSSALRSFARGPLLQSLGFDLVGPDVRLYWDQAVYKKPGTQAPFPWHQDNGYAYVEPQQYLTLWIALSDTDEQSGCPWVVPGLHRRGTLRHGMSEWGHVCFEGEPADALPVPARAGDIVAFSSLTPHATGPNRSARVRRAYIVQLAPAAAAVHWRDREGCRHRTPADDPDRQFPILVRGAPPSSE